MSELVFGGNGSRANAGAAMNGDEHTPTKADRLRLRRFHRGGPRMSMAWFKKYRELGWTEAGEPEYGPGYFFSGGFRLSRMGLEMARLVESKGESTP